jgi:hypothetical protein
MAGFSKDGGGYFLGRAQVVPPFSLQLLVFPWLDKWELRFRGFARSQQDFARGGLDKQDLAGDRFLKLLQHLRVVLLQDLAILQPGTCMLYLHL